MPGSLPNTEDKAINKTDAHLLWWHLCCEGNSEMGGELALWRWGRGAGLGVQEGQAGPGFAVSGVEASLRKHV